MKSGIVGYGAYAPKHYVLATDIDPRAASLGLSQKALAAWDEDSVTMACEAGLSALGVAGITSDKLGAVYVGSESPPYAVNPSSTIVADVLGVGEAYKAVDLQFACKAATAGLQMALAQVEAHQIDYGLVIGSDKSQAEPGDVLEWSAGAAAAALVVGTGNVLASVQAMTSISSDTPDFWRRDGSLYPQHGGRFTGEPAYFHHVLTASQAVLNQSGLSPEAIDYVVLHMPNGKFPVKAAQMLGFPKEKLLPSLTVTKVGNPYSASALLGLIAILEILKPGERVLVTAYGSGAGADSMILVGEPGLTKYRWKGLDSVWHHQQRVGIADYRDTGRWR